MKDDVHVEAAKYSYLVLRGPSAFKNTFNEVGLELDLDKIAEAFWLRRLDIPLPLSCSPEEIHQGDLYDLFLSGSELRKAKCRESAF